MAQGEVGSTSELAPPSAATCAIVRVESGFYEGLEWSLHRSSTVIGRGRHADLLLNEATISRAHALLGRDGERVFVQDLGSTNGTLVNGTRAERQELEDGDELTMGRLILRVRISNAEEVAVGV
ncbi:MAG: FHA domain-containing protein [bacterium]|nr:FHA domain-containing protein [bacterium]